MLARVAARMRNRGLFRALQSLQANVRQRQFNRALLHRFAMRMMDAKRYRALERLAEHAQQRRTNRLTLGRIVLRLTNRRMYAVAAGRLTSAAASLVLSPLAEAPHNPSHRNPGFTRCGRFSTMRWSRRPTDTAWCWWRND